MNALSSTCLGCLLGCLIAAPAVGAPVRASPARIRVAADNNYPPYLFLDADGKPQGYEVDAWRLFETHTGIKVELETTSWTDAQQALLSGNADVIDMIDRTPSRESLYDFSTPYASSPVGIYVDRSIRGVHDAASLRGFPVGVERGDACAERLRSLGITDLHLFGNNRDIMQATTQGDLRIFCMDGSAANFYLYRYSEPDHFYRAFVLYTGHLHRAVRKGDAALLQTVQQGMAQITPAERETLRKRWLDQPTILRPYLRKAEIALAVVLALVALMTLWVWSLRRTVARRTLDLQRGEAKLRALFDASPDEMTVKDSQGIYTDCNESAVKRLQMRRDEILGRTVRDLFGPEISDSVQAIDEEVLRLGQPRTYQDPFIARHGDKLRRYETVKVPLRASSSQLGGILSITRDITERVQADEQLRMWAHAFQHAAFGVAIFDARTQRITHANPTFARERGYTSEEMAGMSVDALYPEDLVAERKAARNAIDRQEHSLVETEQVTRDGRRFPVLLDISVLHGDDGKAQYAVVRAQDITERKRAESELRLAAAAFETQEAMMVTDANAVIQRVNDACVRLTGYAAAELVGQPTTMLRSRQHEAFYQQVRERIREMGLWQGEMWLQVKHGEPKPVRMMISRVRNTGGAVSHYICSMVDLTAERIARASVDHMTFFDPITDLPNRFFLQGRLQHLLGDAAEPNGGVLLLIDLDHFKRINDLRGYAAGDKLLSQVAQRLLKSLDERGLLGRLGGGTFALLEGCHEDDRESRAWHCARRIREILLQPFDLGDGTVMTMTASIGWTALVPGQGTPDSLLKEAELAMYAAKSGGRDQARRFEPSMQHDLLRRELLIHDLRNAIADGGLALHLQALTDRTGRITGAEMLLRWTRPGGEAVSPAEFIPVAEESGLILPLGNWVLDCACSQLAAWSAQPSTRGLSLAINVSARQFTDPGFVNRVRRALAAKGADPARLKLEITETAILGDLAETSGKLAQLRAQGIRVALDDFGTGYSSLTYLSRLPLDQIKIDQSFVARLPNDANDAMVTQTIVAMGHGLGMEVVAEGVETEAQLDLLMAHGCDAFQGYLIARPMPLAAFEAMFEERMTLV